MDRYSNSKNNILFFTVEMKISPEVDLLNIIIASDQLKASAALTSSVSGRNDWKK
jgi:hypothetical protein